MKHVLLTNNGTSATHCIIKSIKLKYQNVINYIFKIIVMSQHIICLY